MEMFKSYINTKNERNIIKYRLEVIEDRKLELETKFLGIQAAPFDEILQEHNPSNNSRVIAFLNEWEIKKQKSGYTLQEEEKILKEELSRLNIILEKMEKSIKQMEGVEYLLFYYIFVENCNPRKAVENVVVISEKSASTVWRHYAKMKEMLY